MILVPEATHRGVIELPFQDFNECKSTALLDFKGILKKKLKKFRKDVWRNEKCCIFAAANEGH